MKNIFKGFLQVLGFLVFEVVYILVLGVYLIYYTNFFTTTRDMIVTTSMTTMTHQYFATWFLSDEKIDEILAASRQLATMEEQKLTDITIKTNNKNEKGKDGIEIIDVSTNTFKGYLMVIDDPSRVALVSSPRMGVVGSTTSQIVEAYDAIGGINAGGMTDDAASTGGVPTGIVISDGEHKIPVNSYDNFSVVGFTRDNKMIVSDSINKAGVDALNLRCAVSFGPVLIINGEPRISNGSGWGIQPRTCIAQRQDGTVLFLVIDGRQTDSVGATLKNAQDILLNHGAYNAFNLDGGASSTMVFDSKVTNKPSDILGERYVPTAFIVK